jgi:hypothetical protein
MASLVARESRHTQMQRILPISAKVIQSDVDIYFMVSFIT